MEKIEQRLRKILSKAGKDKGILAVMLFGSYARGGPYRDIDVCLVLAPRPKAKAFDKRLEYSEYKDIDISVFQELPIYVRKRVLKEGIVKLCKDEDALYELALKTIREFEFFKPGYELYLEGVANG